MAHILMAANSPQSRNTSSANYSAILGGCGNNDGGVAYAGIFGCGITAILPCTLHVNQLWANTLPNGLTTPPLPQNTVFWMPAGSPAPSWLSATGGQLWIA